MGRSNHDDGRVRRLKYLNIYTILGCIKKNPTIDWFLAIYSFTRPYFHSFIYPSIHPSTNWFTPRSFSSIPSILSVELPIFNRAIWLNITTLSRYGDITPKTILGRLFTIVWISVGLVILAMYMGVVTTSLTTTRLEGTQHFYGITVCVLVTLLLCKSNIEKDYWWWCLMFWLSEW